MKDLTFLKDGNDTKVDGLINFEKFRMIAKEIRHLCSMCSAKYVSFLFESYVYLICDRCDVMYGNIVPYFILLNDKTK